MFIKLSFYEEFINVPACWSGLLVSLKGSELVSVIPNDVIVNKIVNKIPKNLGYTYDYYYNNNFIKNSQLPTILKSIQNQFATDGIPAMSSKSGVEQVHKIIHQFSTQKRTVSIWRFFLNKIVGHRNEEEAASPRYGSYFPII